MSITASEKSWPSETERLRFRTWSEADVALANELWGDPRVTKLIDAREKLSEADVRERLAREIKTQNEDQISYWPLFETRGDRFVGCAGLRPYGDDAQVREFGVQLVYSCWGQGFATEAGRSVIAYAFDGLGLDALFAGHHPVNEGSRVMLTKLGFRFTHEAFYKPTGLMHPSYVLQRSDRKETT